MAGSRLSAQFAARAALDQFRIAAEDLSYSPRAGGADVALHGVVDRQLVPLDDRRDDGVYEIRTVQATVLAVADSVFGGLVLNAADRLAFVGTSFSCAVEEGGEMISGWIVRSITGGPGTWELTLELARRIETGNARRAPQ